MRTRWLPPISEKATPAEVRVHRTYASYSWCVHCGRDISKHRRDRSWFHTFTGERGCSTR